MNQIYNEGNNPFIYTFTQKVDPYPWLLTQAYVRVEFKILYTN